MSLLSICASADGGTSCNIPSKGFGDGYGSFQIGKGPIHRRKFGPGYSNNAAEIEIIASALTYIETQWDASELEVMFYSDSQVALAWLKASAEGSLKKLSEGASEGMRSAIAVLRIIAPRFLLIRTEWHPRSKSVAAFGH